jgi:hypothetical protein
MSAVRAAVAAGVRITLPGVDKEASTAHTVVYEPNAFGGLFGDFRYQMEGEEDLLHLIITRADGAVVSVEDGQAVADAVWADVPKALIWFRPGIYGQHFYIGHDDLVTQ